ncbi:MAG: alpha-hydroxy-acid oxidizing protein [Methylophilaceae bacterium]|nr:alpha-hydroxy-acid oxidizing protein [Methylophilaceae bacterium]
MASPRLNVCPDGIRTAQDYRPYAERNLEPAVWQYLQEGEPNVHERQAFEAMRLVPRPLSDVRGGHTRIRLLGETLMHPILLAPVAYQRLFHPDGECASAMAAAAQDGLMVVSSLASQPLEEIIAAAGRPLWFQLYWQGSRERTLRLLRRAQAAGYSAVMWTVDAPVKQAVMRLSAHVAAVNLEPPLPLPELLQYQSVVFDGWMTQAPTWEDVAWLRDQTDLPLLLKGILHPEDASRAIDLGCEGIVVSSHGGRVLPGGVTAIDALPAIVQRLDGRVPVLFDSGIRDGRDVFGVLALGADAVMIGRPYLWGLATAGALGVAHVIRLMRDELEMVMALSGRKQLEDIRVRSLA